MSYSLEGTPVGPKGSEAKQLGIAPLVAVGIGAKIVSVLKGKPAVTEDEQLRRNQVAYELAAQGDTDALAYLKARGGITAPISGNLLSKQFGSADGYMGSPGSKYPRVAPDAKAKASAIMGSVTGGTTLTSPLLASIVPSGMSPLVLGLLGAGLLFATTRKGR